MGKLTEGFWDFFVPKNFFENPEERRVAVFLVIFTFFASTLFLLTTIRWFRMGESVLATNILLVMFGVIFAPFLQKLIRSSRVTAAYMMTLLAWYFLFYIWRTGGMDSSALSWLLVFPVLAAVFQGLWACVAWSVTMGLALCFFHYGPQMGIVFPLLDVTSAQRSDLRFGDFARQLSSVAVCMYVIERLRLQAMAAQKEADAKQAKAMEAQARSARDVERHMKNLEQVFQRTAQNACDLLDASKELAASSANMGGEAGKTARFSAEVKEGTQEIKEILHVMASSVEETAVSIREVRDRINEGASVARMAVKEADSANEMIDNLSESSRRIGKVTAVIQEISEQTNLLALNATIEAARAGEAGKGFAVVAGEIKDLSRKTREATEEIRNHISGNEETVAKVVLSNQAISRTIAQIREGEESIAAAVEQQSVVIQDIASRIGESAQRSDDAAEHVLALNEAVERIREDIEKMVASSGFLEKMAKDLNDTCEMKA
ncbi:methyl-accepting chemotaxis protein [Desulfobotulus sp. H1]|uniref:Methyl-accepting chemotaxis protein n=1 Tax=Desulfobotulus pelophilus TaxID=2823377 RepID=A0ABT3N7Z2_9BACT|nr:methyl-accepting chemotaxis protein [Desulfobotulus pelophilus]MCW7753579.1 methyl-accepting chemotaxis protein [Desulfobotulus pelophilus]